MDDRTRKVQPEIFEPYRLRELQTENNEDPNRPARPTLKTAILWSLALLIALATYWYLSTEKAAAPPPRAFQPPPVAIATIARGPIHVKVNALGTVTPLANVTVKTQINGQLLDVAFREGQTVKKGDLLAQIDPRPYELLQARYEGQLVHDQGLLDQAKIDLIRYQTLVKQNSIARQQAEDQVFLVKQYEGSIESDEAQIGAQKLNLDYARIVSPIDGRVGLRLVDPGNYIMTSSSGIAVLTQLRPISVIFVLPEDVIPQIIAKMNVGTPPEVTIYDRANINELAIGHVVTLHNEVDPTTGTVKIRAEFDNQDERLFPGQFVNVTLLIETLLDVVTAPAAAVLRDERGTYVYVVGAGNKVSPRKVELGPQDGGKVVVRTGLAPGDRVVTDGAERLRGEGMSVVVVESDGKAVAMADLKDPMSREMPKSSFNTGSGLRLGRSRGGE